MNNLIIVYQIFELNDNGELVASKNEGNESLREYDTEENALKSIESGSSQKEYFILKKIMRESNLLDDLESN